MRLTALSSPSFGVVLRNSMDSHDTSPITSVLSALKIPYNTGFAHGYGVVFTGPEKDTFTKLQPKFPAQGGIQHAGFFVDAAEVALNRGVTVDPVAGTFSYKPLGTAEGGKKDFQPDKLQATLAAFDNNPAPVKVDELSAEPLSVPAALERLYHRIAEASKVRDTEKLRPVLREVQITH